MYRRNGCVNSRLDSNLAVSSGRRRLKPIVARTSSHHKFYPRSPLRFIVIYKTDGGFVAIISLNVCFVTPAFRIISRFRITFLEHFIATTEKLAPKLFP